MVYEWISCMVKKMDSILKLHYPKFVVLVAWVFLGRFSLYIYIYIYTRVCVCVYIYIRERERVSQPNKTQIS